MVRRVTMSSAKIATTAGIIQDRITGDGDNGWEIRLHDRRPDGYPTLSDRLPVRRHV